VFGLEFQRGLLLTGVAEGRWRRDDGRGVSVCPLEDADGEGRPWLAVVTARGVLFIRGRWLDPVDPGGMLAYLLLVPGRLAVALPLRLLPLGVDGSPLPPDMTTEDAGELPGVSMALVAADLSMLIMLDIESRSCWCLAAFSSSSARSMTLILSARVAHLVVMSE
jgi:hypothetical protein